MKKGLTLIEVLVAVTIFSFLSVSLYFLLRAGIFVRDRIESEQEASQNVYLNLEKISQELRNVIFYKENDPEHPALKGGNESIEFYTLLFDYSKGYPRILHITYTFKEGVLSRTIREPFKDEFLRAYDFLENVEKVNFYYFDGEEGEKWQDRWEDAQRLPEGVRIELTYQDRRGKEHSFNKYVFIYKQRR